NLQRSLIGSEYQPIRSRGQQFWVCGRDRATLIVAEDFQGLDAGVPKRAIAAQVLQSERVFHIQWPAWPCVHNAPLSQDNPELSCSCCTAHAAPFPGFQHVHSITNFPET